VYAAAASDSVAIRNLAGDLRPDLVTVGGFGEYLTTEVNRCLAP
jgi:hypothetical protein